jgi:transposase
VSRSLWKNGVTPPAAALAGLLLLARQIADALGLTAASLDDVMAELGAGRSQSYEWAGRLRDWLQSRPGRGRPRKERAPADRSDASIALALCKQVRDWLLAHPGGAVAGPKRTTYTDDFRAFVVDLVAAEGFASEMSRTDAADAVGVFPGTLARWLSPPAPETQEAAPEDGASDKPARISPSVASVSPDVSVSKPISVATNEELPSAGKSGDAAKVLALWGTWSGSVETFCRSLEAHGLQYSPGAVRSLLDVTDERPVRRRHGKNPDAEFTRGDYERPDPNTQWSEDGTNLPVTIGEHTYRRSVQAFVDVGSDKIVGHGVRPHEDSKGLLAAYGRAKAATGATPDAVIRDNRKCNGAGPIGAVLEGDNVIGMYGTPKRPTSNAIPETAFSHLKQRLPRIVLPEPDKCTREELADAVLDLAIECYKAGRNMTPRRRLKGRSPDQTLAGHRTNPERKAQQRERMVKLQHRMDKERDSETSRNRQATTMLVEEAFEELGMQDSNGRKVERIARYGLEATTEAIGVLKARIQAGTGPDGHKEKFLLNTTRHIAYRNQDTRIFETLLDQRVKAGAIILKPLEDELARLRQELAPEALPRAVLHRAIYSPTRTDRIFWRRTFMADFDRLPIEHRGTKPSSAHRPEMTL